MALEVGNVVEGIVTGVTNFGAFVKLPDGRTGLVHISEVADAYVKDIKEFVNKDDSVKVKILSFDDDGKKIGLSIRQANPSYSAGNGRARGRRGGSSSRMSFEDKLSRFMKESDEKLKDLRSANDSRRGGKKS